jgi:hypothetical protein
LTPLLFRDILFFGITERPNFIALDMLTGEILEDFILIFGARFPEIGQELNDCILGYAGHPNGSPDRIPLNKGRDDLGLFLDPELIHVYNIHDRSSIVKHYFYATFKS